jgi:hypothetical protein
MKLARVHILALAAAAVLAASALPWPAFLAGAELCPFHALTGLPCPGCGLTRAFRAIAHGEFQAAWGFNPFGFLFFALALVLAAAPLWTRAAPQASAVLARGKTQAVLAFVLVGSMLVYGAVRAVEVLAAQG